MNLDILISGVGGQGSVLASRALALTAMERGLAVRTSEVIGMAQREGSVVSHVRIGEELYGAIIPDRRADFLLGLELAETARALNKLKPGGIVLTGTTTIVPATVQLGLSTYDREAITNYIKKQAGKVFFLDLEELSRRAGHARTGNVVILAPFRLSGLPGSDQMLRRLLFVTDNFGINGAFEMDTQPWRWRNGPETEQA